MAKTTIVSLPRFVLNSGVALLQRSRPQPLRRPIRQNAFQRAPAFASRRCHLVVAKRYLFCLLLSSRYRRTTTSPLPLPLTTCVRTFGNMSIPFPVSAMVGLQQARLATQTGTTSRRLIVSKLATSFRPRQHPPNITKYPDILATTPTEASKGRGVILVSTIAMAKYFVHYLTAIHTPQVTALTHRWQDDCSCLHARTAAFLPAFICFVPRAQHHASSECCPHPAHGANPGSEMQALSTQTPRRAVGWYDHDAPCSGWPLTIIVGPGQPTAPALMV